MNWMRVVTAGKWKTHMKKEKYKSCSTFSNRNYNFSFPKKSELRVSLLFRSKPTNWPATSEMFTCKHWIQSLWYALYETYALVARLVLFLRAAQKTTHTDIHFARERAKIRRPGIRNNVTRDTAPKYKGFLPFGWLDISFWLDSWHTMNYKV